MEQEVGSSSKNNPQKRYDSMSFSLLKERQVAVGTQKYSQCYF